MERIAYRTPGSAQTVLEKRSRSHGSCLVIEVATETPDIVIIEIDRSPGMESENIGSLYIFLWLRESRREISERVRPFHAFRCREPLFLRGQCVSYPVVMYISEIHLLAFISVGTAHKFALAAERSEIYLVLVNDEVFSAVGE